MEYRPTFSPRSFTSYRSLNRYHRNHPELNCMFEYKQDVKLGVIDPFDDDPRFRERKSSVKFCETREEYKKFNRAEKFATCMDIAHDKGCAVGKYRVLGSNPNVDFVRYPQGFDPDVAVSGISLFNIWKDCSEYRQVSAGITHLFRNILIVDIDNNDKSVTVPAIHQAIRSANLPCPNYIITHHKEDRDTYQLGFLMENALKVKDAEGVDTISNKVNHSKYYITLVHEINRVLPGDVHYSGWQVKNPYFCQNAKDFSVQWFTEEPVSSWYDIRTTLGIPLTTCNLNTSSIALCNNTTRSSKVSKKKSVSTPKESSRNYHLRMFIAEQVRKHQAHITESALLSLCLSHASDFARLAGKCEAQSPDEITRVVHSSYNYFVTTYKPVSTAEGNKSYSSVSRQCSQLKRSLSRFYKALSVYDLQSLGFSRSDILEQLNLDSAHFSRYNLRQEQLLSQLSELLSGFKATQKYFIGSNSNKDFWSKAISDLSRLQKDFFQPSFVSEFLVSVGELKLAA